MDPIDPVMRFLVGQGILGIIVIGLGTVVAKLWAELKAERAVHKVEIAAKDALIKELQEQRLAEALAGREVQRSVQTSLDAFLAAIHGGKTI